MNFSISDNAAGRISALIDVEKKPFFRVRVDGGGCNGFQYHFGFDEEKADDDMMFEKNGIQVAVDEASLSLLDGSELDYVEEMLGSYFTVRNPNATSSCGCGTSFSI